MKFAEIPAHEAAKERLRRMVDSGRLPHALLISGPEGSGKLSLARALAQYLQCTNRHGGDSCGECPSCRQHQSLNHADMHYVYPIVKSKAKGVLISEDEIEHWREFIPQARFASYRNWLEVIEAGNSQPLIYVEEADNILRICNMTSYTSPFKVVLIWLPEKLHVAAANKLLKIIEEPWEDTRFVLVSNDPGSILPTIFSRTQRLNLSRLSDSEIASLLVREYSIDPLQAEDLAKTADGNAATALQAISHQGENEQFEALYRDVMRKAYAKDVKALRELGDQAAGLGREKNIRLLAYFARMARENFLYNLRVPGLNRLTAREEQFSSRFSPFVNAANVEAMLADFDQSARDISLNANAKMVMFDTFLRLIVLLHKK